MARATRSNNKRESRRTPKNVRHKRDILAAIMLAALVLMVVGGVIIVFVYA